MWDQIQRSDVELARQKLAELRSMTMQRHAEELKQLDADEADIEMLASLAEKVTEKYLNGSIHSEEQSAAVEESTRTHQELSPTASLEVSQNVSPNFRGPFRRFVGR